MHQKSTKLTCYLYIIQYFKGQELLLMILGGTKLVRKMPSKLVFNIQEMRQ